MSLMEPIKQSSSDEVNENKDVKISIVKSKKITITIINTISAGIKLLTVSTNMTLPESG